MSKKTGPQKGFTLIELIVVIVIIITLTGFGLAGYNNFNQRQTLKQAAEEVKSNLRDAQNRALSGEKTIAGGTCDSRTLEYWKVIITLPRTYTISGSCSGQIFGTKTFSLASILQFSSGQEIIFKPLGQGGSSRATIIISHMGTTPTITITIEVYPAGDITIGNII